MNIAPKPIVFSTAGAVPVKDEKGQIRMEKTKVARYFAGKRPEYASAYSSEEEDEIVCKSLQKESNDASFAISELKIENESASVRKVVNKRLQRLMEINDDDVGSDAEISQSLFVRREEEVMDFKINEETKHALTDEEDEVSEDEIQRRREILRKRATMKVEEEEEAMELEEEISKEQQNQEESEYEECSDSEPEEEPQLLKPVFVGKNRRTTESIKVLSNDERIAQDLEINLKRRETTLLFVEDELKWEAEIHASTIKPMEDVITDDENEEESYCAWKLRELTRYKRDKEEREKHLKEKEELERQRNMTEEERLKELELNPKVITNKLNRGRYKFLQKYYHRGAFFLDKETDILKRDTTAPTLEDHFDKTVLPKALQVKNFGRIGRTKYTHLLDQDTTKFDSPWTIGEKTELIKTRRGGMKEPDAKRLRVK